MKPIFGRGPSLQLRLFLAVIISVAAIVADSRFGVFSHVRVYLSSLVSPLQYMANAPGIMLDTMSTQVQTRAGLIELLAPSGSLLLHLKSVADNANIDGRAGLQYASGSHLWRGGLTQSSANASIVQPVCGRSFSWPT